MRLKARSGGWILAALIGTLATAYLCPEGWAAPGETPATTTRPSDSPACEPRPPASSQPASQIVLVRLGDKGKVTQEDFERWARAIPPELYDKHKDGAMRAFVDREYLRIYAQENPDLVPEDRLKAMLEETMKMAKAKNQAEFEKKLAEKGTTFEQSRLQHLLLLAQTNLGTRGAELAKDEKLVNEIYEENPHYFDGSMVTARHILISVPPYDTPAQKAAKRERLAKIRDDLVSGRRTWKECVQESDDETKAKDGLLGSFVRHLQIAEPVAAAAWVMEVNEISDIIESHLGFHIVQTLAYKPGNRSPAQAKEEVKHWLEYKQYPEVLTRMAEKYPTIGVQPPIRPADLPTPDKAGKDRQKRR